MIRTIPLLLAASLTVSFTACQPATPNAELAETLRMQNELLAQLAGGNAREDGEASRSRRHDDETPALFRPAAPSLYRSQWVADPDNPATPGAMRFLDSMWLLRAEDGTWNARMADFSNHDPACLGAPYCVLSADQNGILAEPVFFSMEHNKLYNAECFVWDEETTGRARPDIEELARLTGKHISYMGHAPSTVCMRAHDAPGWVRAQLAF